MQRADQLLPPPLGSVPAWDKLQYPRYWHSKLSWRNILMRPPQQYFVLGDSATLQLP